MSGYVLQIKLKLAIATLIHKKAIVITISKIERHALHVPEGILGNLSPIMVFSCSSRVSKLLLVCASSSTVVTTSRKKKKDFLCCSPRKPLKQYFWHASYKSRIL